MRIPPAPGTSCPRQPSEPGCVHHIQAQDVWLPEGANPIMAHNRGVSVPPPVAREKNGVAAAANRECGVMPQPLCELPAPPLIC